jgi:hypothetical protein
VVGLRTCAVPIPSHAAIQPLGNESFRIVVDLPFEFCHPQQGVEREFWIRGGLVQVCIRGQKDPANVRVVYSRMSSHPYPRIVQDDQLLCFPILPTTILEMSSTKNGE